MERGINFPRKTYIHFTQKVYTYRTGIVVPRLGNAATMERAVYAQNEAGTI